MIIALGTAEEVRDAFQLKVEDVDDVDEEPDPRPTALTVANVAMLGVQAFARKKSAPKPKPGENRKRGRGRGRAAATLEPALPWRVHPIAVTYDELWAATDRDNLWSGWVFAVARDGRWRVADPTVAPLDVEPDWIGQWDDAPLRDAFDMHYHHSLTHGNKEVVKEIARAQEFSARVLHHLLPAFVRRAGPVLSPAFEVILRCMMLPPADVVNEAALVRRVATIGINQWYDWGALRTLEDVAREASALLRSRILENGKDDASRDALAEGLDRYLAAGVCTNPVAMEDVLCETLYIERPTPPPSPVPSPPPPAPARARSSRTAAGAARARMAAAAAEEDDEDEEEDV